MGADVKLIAPFPVSITSDAGLMNTQQVDDVRRLNPGDILVSRDGVVVNMWLYKWIAVIPERPTLGLVGWNKFCVSSVGVWIIVAMINDSDDFIYCVSNGQGILGWTYPANLWTTWTTVS